MVKIQFLHIHTYTHLWNLIMWRGYFNVHIWVCVCLLNLQTYLPVCTTNNNTPVRFSIKALHFSSLFASIKTIFSSGKLTSYLCGYSTQRCIGNSFSKSITWTFPMFVSSFFCSNKQHEASDSVVLLFSICLKIKHKEIKFSLSYFLKNLRC